MNSGSNIRLRMSELAMTPTSLPSSLTTGKRMMKYGSSHLGLSWVVLLSEADLKKGKIHAISRAIIARLTALVLQY
jgi:hypothetical protein